MTSDDCGLLPEVPVFSPAFLARRVWAESTEQSVRHAPDEPERCHSLKVITLTIGATNEDAHSSHLEEADESTGCFQ
jgi:hypothetical protein